MSNINKIFFVVHFSMTYFKYPLKSTNASLITTKSYLTILLIYINIYVFLYIIRHLNCNVMVCLIYLTFLFRTHIKSSFFFSKKLTKF